MRESRAADARVWWFDSTQELADRCDALAREDRKCDRDWTGETWREAAEGARRGRTGGVARAEAVMEQVMSRVDAPRTEWAASVAGAYPMVPDALMGHPASMRRRVEAYDDRSPLRVFVDLTSSAGISPAELLDRGTACLALAMAFAAERPVEVYACVALGRDGIAERNGAVAVRIGSAPLDLAVACNALTSTGFSRGLCYSWINAHVHAFGGGKWHWGWGLKNPWVNSAYAARMREALGVAGDDVFIAPAYLQDPLLRDPVAFVNREIDKHRAAHE